MYSRLTTDQGDRVMIKLLIDDLGRIVGKATVKKGESGNREYGTRSERGFECIGIARLVNISSVDLSNRDPNFLDDLGEFLV